MENNEASASNQHQPEVVTSSSLFSELIAAYLEYVRVEQSRPPITVERYRARLERFIDELGDCPVGEIAPAKLSLYKRHLMDAGLGAVTIGGFLSCLRGFLRYVRDVQGLAVMDAEKIKRPRIPQRTVDYLTKEELDRLLAAIPTHTWKGLRDRALIEVLFSSGMRISEVLGLNRELIEWELREERAPVHYSIT